MKVLRCRKAPRSGIKAVAATGGYHQSFYVRSGSFEMLFVARERERLNASVETSTSATRLEKVFVAAKDPELCERRTDSFE